MTVYLQCFVKLFRSNKRARLSAFFSNPNHSVRGILLFDTVLQWLYLYHFRLVIPTIVNHISLCKYRMTDLGHSSGRFQANSRNTRSNNECSENMISIVKDTLL